MTQAQQSPLNLEVNVDWNNPAEVQDYLDSLDSGEWQTVQRVDHPFQIQWMYVQPNDIVNHFGDTLTIAGIRKFSDMVYVDTYCGREFMINAYAKPFYLGKVVD